MIRVPPIAARVFAAFAFLFAAVLFATGPHTVSVLALLVGLVIFVMGGPTRVVAQRSADRFALERGGILPSLRQAKQYALSSVDGAALESWIGPRDALGTKVVVNFNYGGKLDVISGDSLAQNVRVIEAVNQFISRGRFGLPSLQDVFRAALEQTGGTAIVVDAENPGTYLLFPATPDGLMFFRPRAGIEINVGGSIEETFEALLRERGASAVETSAAGTSGFFGRDTDRPEAFARLVFERVYRKPHAKFIASFSPRVYLRPSAPSSR